jgi:3-oxoacyl-[acyl-carrier protein] reductase
MQNIKTSIAKTLAPKKIALVVGGSKGIGLAIAQKLIEDGFFVVATYNKTTPSLKDNNCIPIKCDITNSDDLANLHNVVAKLNYPLSCIVNNAGIVSKRESLEEMDENTIRKIFETNLISPMLLIKKFTELLKKGSLELGFASIINITSQAATFGGSNLSSYASSKGGLNTLTIALAKELATFGIRVNAISPAIIDTDMHNFVNQAQKDAIAKTIPLGYLGSVDEVANLASFLASQNSSYITGAIIPITGGR